jgi:hypothetical protein
MVICCCDDVMATSYMNRYIEWSKAVLLYVNQHTVNVCEVKLYFNMFITSAVGGSVGIIP